MRRLYVIAHGLSPKKTQWEQFKQWLQKATGADPDDIKLWDHSTKRWSLGRMDKLSEKLRDEIDQWDFDDVYDEIILIGHSMGGVLVRDTYLRAADPTHGDVQISPWHKKVKRIVLLASINRGFVPKRSLSILVVVRLLQLIGQYRRFVFSDLTEGAEFITNLRLRWINYFSSQPQEGLPEIVQILGSEDGVVSREDSIDLDQFPAAYHQDVKGENHAELYYLKDNHRQKIFEKCIINTLPPPQLKQKEQENNSVKTVVVLLHGIRASKDGWVKDAKRLISEHPQGKDDKQLQVYDYSYGFFAAVEFIIPYLRHNQVRWFQNLYSDLRGQYPKAIFHFIGHSNGTYMLGHSLEKIRPGIKFGRVALAGSALPSNFDWEECFDSGQVTEVQNHRSRKDWVIAWVASAVSFFFKDVGTGGYAGFLKTPPRMRDYAFYDGGHSRPCESDNLPHIVRFILEGQSRPDDVDPKIFKPLPRYDILSRVFYYLLPSLILVLFILLLILLYRRFW